MKKLTVFLGVFAFLSMANSVNAQVTVIDSGYCGASGNNLSWKLTSDSVLTISGSGAMADYYWAVKTPWDAYKNNIATVVINDSVTTIGHNAFGGYINLTSVTIGDSVTTIGDYVFLSCSSLTSVTIGNSVTVFGSFAFSDCSSLSTITIPENVIYIGNSAFENCTNLQTVNFNAINCTSFGSGSGSYNKVFYNCNAFTTLNIGDAVQNIQSYAFYVCKALTTVTIGNSVTNIARWAFYYCSNLDTVNFNAINCTSIGTSGASAFLGSPFTTLNIGSMVKTIPNYAFYNCWNLTSVIIPDNVISLGESAFSACSGLISVTIGNSVISIGNTAFGNCSSLISVTIGNSVASIGNRAFENCNNLTSVIIPESVTTIGECAFQNCNNLISITIPNRITRIESYTFQNCSSLTSVTISNGVTMIKNRAFDNCKGLTSITAHAIIPPALGDNVFLNVPVNIPVYIPCGSYNSYSKASVWSNFTNFIDSLPLPKPIITQNNNLLTSSAAHSYQWYFNNSPISGATNQTYSYTQNGVYFVEIANAEGCTAKSDEITIDNVGIKNYELRNTNYVIYPNPTTGRLTINCEDKGACPLVKVYNVAGQVVYTSTVSALSTETTIDISHLANGLYFLKVDNKMFKIIKN